MHVLVEQHGRAEIVCVRSMVERIKNGVGEKAVSRGSTCTSVYINGCFVTGCSRARSKCITVVLIKPGCDNRAYLYKRAHTRQMALAETSPPECLLPWPSYSLRSMGLWRSLWFSMYLRLVGVPIGREKYVCIVWHLMLALDECILTVSAGTDQTWKLFTDRMGPTDCFV